MINSQPDHKKPTPPEEQSKYYVRDDGPTVRSRLETLQGGYAPAEKTLRWHRSTFTPDDVQMRAIIDTLRYGNAWIALAVNLEYGTEYIRYLDGSWISSFDHDKGLYRPPVELPVHAVARRIAEKDAHLVLPEEITVEFDADEEPSEPDVGADQ